MKKNIIGIIGGGNMGEALIKGLLKKKKFNILVCETFPKRVEYVKKKYKVTIKEEIIPKVLSQAQIIIFAVKPQDMHAAFAWIRSDDIRENKLFISIAAGLTTKYFENNIKNVTLNPKPRIIRAMPNMPALIGKGITAVSAGSYATEKDMKVAQEILQTLGKTVEVEGTMMDAVTAVSGSGPAYVFLFLEMWIKVAHELGLDIEVAEQLVMETLVGSARLIEKKNFSAHDLLYLRAEEIRAKVTSKGGTTEAAMNVFTKDDAFLNLIRNALGAADRRAKELAM